MGAFVPLKRINEFEAKDVGQKALLLGQKSVNNPFSLVITTNVFIEFIHYNKLLEEANILFSNQESSTENLLRGFNQFTHKVLKGRFPPEISQSLRECFELACLDTQSLDVLQGKKTQPTILSLRRSTTYNDQDIISKGVIYTKEGSYDEFLHALKTIYLSAFTPSSVVSRQKQGVSDFSIAVIVSRLPSYHLCFETAYASEQKKLFVSSFVGFFDKAREIQRDTFDIGVDFLQINNQNIVKQTRVGVFDLQENKPAIKPFDTGVSQSATQQQVLEIARLTKKIATEFKVPSLMTDMVMDKENKIFLLDIWTSQEVNTVPQVQKEIIDVSGQPTSTLQQAIIDFLKEHKNTSYADTINIILRSLETDSSNQTIVQGLLLCKEILEN